MTGMLGEQHSLAAGDGHRPTSDGRDGELG